MKLLSVIIFILSIRTREDLSFESWVWTWAWIRLAITCPVAAPACYIRHGTDWSTMVCFVGDTAQAFVAVQSMFIVHFVKVRLNEGGEGQ